MTNYKMILMTIVMMSAAVLTIPPGSTQSTTTTTCVVIETASEGMEVVLTGYTVYTTTTGDCTLLDHRVLLLTLDEHANTDTRSPGRQVQVVAEAGETCPTKYVPVIDISQYGDAYPNDITSAVELYGCDNVKLYEHAPSDPNYPGSTYTCTLENVVECGDLSQVSFNDMASAFTFKAV